MSTDNHMVWIQPTIPTIPTTTKTTTAATTTTTTNTTNTTNTNTNTDNTPSSTTNTFSVGDLVLCQYDRYPIWPAVIQRAEEGPRKGRFHDRLRTTNGEYVDAYFCFFPDDDSGGWIRHDLIVKFHPSFVTFIRASSSSVRHAHDQGNALDIALLKYHQCAVKNQSCLKDRCTIAKMLGQWSLLGCMDDNLNPPTLVVAPFNYNTMLKDGRKLPHLLRVNLAPLKYWPRIPIPTVNMNGAVEADDDYNGHLVHENNNKDNTNNVLNDCKIIIKKETDQHKKNDNNNSNNNLNIDSTNHNNNNNNNNHSDSHSDSSSEGKQDGTNITPTRISRRISQLKRKTHTRNTRASSSNNNNNINNENNCKSNEPNVEKKNLFSSNPLQSTNFSSVLYIPPPPPNIVDTNNDNDNNNNNDDDNDNDNDDDNDKDDDNDNDNDDDNDKDDDDDDSGDNHSIRKENHVNIEQDNSSEQEQEQVQDQEQEQKSDEENNHSYKETKDKCDKAIKNVNDFMRESIDEIQEKELKQNETTEEKLIPSQSPPPSNKKEKESTDKRIKLLQLQQKSTMSINDSIQPHRSSVSDEIEIISHDSKTNFVTEENAENNSNDYLISNDENGNRCKDIQGMNKRQSSSAANNHVSKRHRSIQSPTAANQELQQDNGDSGEEEITVSVEQDIDEYSIMDDSWSNCSLLSAKGTRAGSHYEIAVLSLLSRGKNEEINDVDDVDDADDADDDDNCSVTTEFKYIRQPGTSAKHNDIEIVDLT